jgi:hypothetical protein
MLKALTFLTAVIFVGLILSGSRSPEQRAASSCTSETEAFVMSQSFVSQKLRAPATASYPWITDNAVSITPTGGECEFLVSAYVDSQNGFGALIRSKYLIRVKYDKATGYWGAWGLSLG